MIDVRQVIATSYFLTNTYLDIPSEHHQCLQSLTLTDPQDDLAGIRRSQGDTVEGTSEWLLVQKTYVAWLVGEGPPLLQLIGDPGIGKTMISSFLVNELEKKAQKSPSMTFAYYFCDNKDEKRRSATAIIRGLLLQLIRQRPILLGQIRIVHDQMKMQTFANFDTLWRILLNVIQDAEAGEVYLLIDALDECEELSREAFLVSLKKLAKRLKASSANNIKVLITCRPVSEIENILGFDDCTLRIDSRNIRADMAKFIDFKINELADRRKRWPPELIREIRKTVQKKIGGTFLWASLVLNDIFKVNTASKVRNKLKELPISLRATYDAILSNIEREDIQKAILLLRWVVVARRPLSVSELAMVGFLEDKEQNHQNYPSKAIQAEYAEDFACCGSLLYRDGKTDTINLVHQSAKDYLLSQDYLGRHPSLSHFYVVSDETNLSIFQACSDYLNMKDFDIMAEGRRPTAKLCDLEILELSPMAYSYFRFLKYAIKYWDNHVLTAGTALTRYEWDRKSLSLRPTLRDSWLNMAVKHGQSYVVKHLLDNECYNNSNGRIFNKLLALAAQEGHLAVVELLLDRKAEINAQVGSYGNALQVAAFRGHRTLVQLLLDKGANINAHGGHFGNALQAAASEGNETEVKLLLDRGAEINAQGGFYGNALLAAASKGYETVVQLLLDRGADINRQSRRYGTALQAAALKGYETKGAWINAQGGNYGNALQGAASEGYETVVELLLDKGAEINAQGGFYGNALQAAASKGYETIVKLLLDRGGDINRQGRKYGTALQIASFKGHKTVIYLLLDRGAEVNARGGFYGNALLASALNGDTTIVELLLEKGAEVNAQGGFYRNALQAAASEGNNTVAQLLLDRGANINVQGGRFGTALQAAAFNGHRTVIKLLLDGGANTENSYGQLALYFAMRGNQKLAIEYMLELGSRIDLVHTDHQGCSALHFAASGGSTEAIRLCLNAGASVNAVDTNGWTALHWACKNGSHAAFQLLIESGAMLQTKDKHGLTPFDVANICDNASLSSTFGTQRLNPEGKQNKFAPAVKHNAYCSICLHVSLCLLHPI